MNPPSTSGFNREQLPALLMDSPEYRKLYAQFLVVHNQPIPVRLENYLPTDVLLAIYLLMKTRPQHWTLDKLRKRYEKEYKTLQ